MKRLALLALLLLLPAVPALAETVSRIAAVVNDEIITTYRLDQALAQRLQAAPKKPSAVETEALRRRVLNDLIDETLVRQRVAELGLKVTDEEVEAAVQDVQKQNHLSREQLAEALRAEGMTLDEYRETLRNQIQRFKLLGREVQSKVEVTNQEIRDYFREHIDDYRELPHLRLAQLTFPIPAKAGAERIEAVRTKAQAALERLRQGESFEAVLATCKAEKNGEGCDLGTFLEGELTPSFAAAVRDLKQGEVSNLVEMPEAFYVLQVTERTPGSIRQFDAVKGEIEKKVKEQKTEEAFRKWAEGLRKNAYIDIRL
jgi:peptidyl-prolyl cis-trans isomerase SurA